jgi:hypothetical protein
MVMPLEDASEGDSPTAAVSNGGSSAGLRVVEEAGGDEVEQKQAPVSASNVDASSTVSTDTDSQVLAAARAASIPPVQVCVRLRPLLPWERSEGHDATALDLQSGAEGSVTLRPRDSAGSDEPARARGFRFDAVFGPEQTQQDMWDMAKVDCLVGRVAAGFHATIFAYGQTGSGKTHTMEGFSYNHNNGTAAPSTAAGRSKAKVKNATPEQLGIVPRSVHRLFAHAEALIAQRRNEGSTEENFSIKVSFLQIYKEKIFDLLNPSHTPAQREAGKGDEFAGLRMRWDAHRRQFFVENLFEYECGSAEEVLQHYANVCRTSMLLLRR